MILLNWLKIVLEFTTGSLQLSLIHSWQLHQLLSLNDGFVHLRKIVSADKIFYLDIVSGGKTEIKYEK